MSYAVKEIYYTIQGEGLNGGRAAVFLRFSGCNLWSGCDQDRGKGRGGCSRWCDTDFVGTNGPLGGHYETPQALAEQARRLWPGTEGRPLVICTGGEPLLQLDIPLIESLHTVGFEVAIETNGTIKVPTGVDWVCVSPKANAPLAVQSGDELKFVYPQEGLDPESFEQLDFNTLLLQPKDGPEVGENTRRVLDYCLTHPKWRVSLQAHKFLQIR